MVVDAVIVVVAVVAIVIVVFVVTLKFCARNMMIVPGLLTNYIACSDMKRLTH